MIDKTISRALFLFIGGSAWLDTAHADTCGDSSIEASEECDDGNTTDGDGCDSTCVAETGWECTEATFDLDFNEDFYGDGVHGGSSFPSWTLSSDGRSVSDILLETPTVSDDSVSNVIPAGPQPSPQSRQETMQRS